MVQPAQSGKRDDFARRVDGPLYQTTVRRVLLESEVWAIVMVVGGVLKDQAAEVSGVEHHDLVEHLAT